MPSRFFKNIVSRPAQPGIPTATGIDPHTATVDTATGTTVVDSVGPTLSTDIWWRAEAHGGLFPKSRIRPIQQAGDVLTRAEKAVYDFLWGSPSSEPTPDFRITQAGYDRIAKAAHVTKRNAALIVARLTEKGFLLLETEADPLHRIARQYRVRSHEAALREIYRRGRRWMVRTGNGVLFANPTTVVFADAATMATGPAETPATVVAGPSDSVPTELPLPTLAEICRTHGITLDPAAARAIPKRCRTYDALASDDEIAYFTTLKIKQLLLTRDPASLAPILLTAVPEFFVQPAHEVQRYRVEKTGPSSRGQGGEATK